MRRHGAGARSRRHPRTGRRGAHVRPGLIRDVTIPVMARARIGHFVEAQPRSPSCSLPPGALPRPPTPRSRCSSDATASSSARASSRAATRCAAPSSRQSPTTGPHHPAQRQHGCRARRCWRRWRRSIAAPVGAVWSMVRRFDRPQAYKHSPHVRASCRLVDGDDGAVGSVIGARGAGRLGPPRH